MNSTAMNPTESLFTEGSNLTLCSLKTGENAVICGYNFSPQNHEIIEKLVSLGLTTGRLVTKSSSGWFGDPITIEVLGSKLALRLNEADCIQIIKI